MSAQISTGQETFSWPKRPNLVVLFFISNLICYMDRVNISITAPLIMKEYDWDEKTLGIILSSFFLGYTLLQIPGGWLADRFGGKKVLTIGVLWWVPVFCWYFWLRQPEIYRSSFDIFCSGAEVKDWKHNRTELNGYCSEIFRNNYGNADNCR